MTSPIRLSPLLLCFALFIGCNHSAPSAPGRQPNATIDPATAASISGTITFEGAAPAPVKLDMSMDAACEMSSKEPNFTQSYVVDKGKLANVYIYVKDGLGNKIYESPKTPAVIDQLGCRYVPHVVAATVDQPIEIRNSDLAQHNVHPSPAVFGNQEWNISQQPRDKPALKTFSQPETMMPVQCNQHAWMRMYLNIAANPFFAVSGADGSFRIDGLPPGTYTIAAVHEKLGEKTQPITVSARQNAQANFSFSMSDNKQ